MSTLENPNQVPMKRLGALLAAATTTLILAAPKLPAFAGQTPNESRQIEQPQQMAQTTDEIIAKLKQEFGETLPFDVVEFNGVVCGSGMGAGGYFAGKNFNGMKSTLVRDDGVFQVVALHFNRTSAKQAEEACNAMFPASH